MGRSNRMINIIVSTRRAHKQVTLSWLKGAGLNKKCFLVINPGEYKSYERWKKDVVEILEVPVEVEPHIGAVRQWVIQRFLEHGTFNLCLLDDDLRFYRRKSENDWHLQKAEPQDMQDMFRWMEQALTRDQMCGQVGISPREGNNRWRGKVQENTRIMRCMAFNLPRLGEAGVKFNTMLMEDFDISLQLLTKGYRNELNTYYAQNQEGSNKEGGCSTYRTPETQAESALQLKEHFPDFVTTVERKTKVAWGWGKRIDVRIQWKKAYWTGVQERAGAIEND
jgi:hypothetical protein